ncbi:MAG: energy transducer TonB [Deltaproteobacteria bacterium]|nr:energy transducer TonB [Deltaproteobacteria bacterium]
MSVFILLSLGLHLFLLQLDVSHRAVQQVAQQQSVGYVSRPVEQFFPASSPRKTAVPELSPSMRAKQSLIKSPRTVVPGGRSLQPRAGKEKTPDKLVPTAEDIAVAAVDRPVPLVVEPVSQKTELSSPVADPQPSTVEAVQQTPTTAHPQHQSVAEQAVAVAAPESGPGEHATVFQQALPRYELNPLPRYPEIDRRRGRQGTVELEVLVLADGRVGETRLVVSSGYKSLDRAAQKSVRHWHFKPATSAGIPVASRVVIPVDFVLDGE